MFTDDLVEKIITSLEALKMKKMVTDGFYDRSVIGLWLFEVIGREYDEMAGWALNLRYEAFPQTCTWSIGIWEFICDLEPIQNLPDDPELALQMRRQRLLVKRWTRPSVNPARTEAELAALLPGYEVHVIENVNLNTFLVDIIGTGGQNNIFDFRNVVYTLRSIKQSHLSFELHKTLTTEFETKIRVAGVAWNGIRTTKLPQYKPNDKHEAQIHVLVFRSSIRQTTLGPMHNEHQALVYNGTIGYQGAVLKLPGGEVVDAVLQTMVEHPVLPGGFVLKRE